MKKIFIIVPAFIFSQFVFGQQLPITNALRNAEFLWNPGMTGISEKTEVSASVRQQWLGFEGAPFTAFVSGRHTLKNLNMGIGGLLWYDRTGPLTFIGFTGAYNYKFSLGINDDDQLSIGVNASLGQNQLNGSKLKYYEADDQLLITNATSAFNFNGGLGVYYSSVPESQQDESHFYLGLSVPQLLPVKLSFSGISSEVVLQKAIHAYAVAGFKLANNYYSTEHTVWANHARSNLYNLSYQFKYELVDAFWASLYINTNFTTGLSSGFIWKNESLGDNGEMRIGLAGLYNLSNKGQYQGFSYEVMTAIRF